MGAIENLNNSLIGLKLKAINTRELALHILSPGDIFRFESGQYIIIFKENRRIDREQLKNLIALGHHKLYVEEETLDRINSIFKELFLKTARSLSIGEPHSNGRKLASFLTISLSLMYKDPLNDNFLNLHYNGSLNLANFLIENKNLSPRLYRDVKKLNQHYINAQPILSSLLTVGFFDFLRVFQSKELENFFITSMFKDIGMSFVPSDKYEIKRPTKEDVSIYQSHTHNSVQILNRRLQLSRSYLDIIANHHFLNERISLIRNKENISRLPYSENITGIETYVVAVMDIIVAMTEDRPYQKKHSLFESLELIKKLMDKDYPTEFKALVVFLRKFFS